MNFLEKRKNNQMISLNMYQGIVVNNDDSNHSDGQRLGRIQVKSLPEHKDIQDSDCPWFRAFLSTANGDEFNFNPPPIGSLVWVLSNPEFQITSFYLPASFIDGFFKISEVESNLSQIQDINLGSYPDLAFNKTADGSIMFHNKTNGAMGILHKSGSYVTISESGDIVSRSSATSSIEVKADGNVIVSGAVKLTGTPPGSGTVETGATSAGDPTSIGTGAFLAIPTCLVTGAPISCYKITGT